MNIKNDFVLLAQYNYINWKNAFEVAYIQIHSFAILNVFLVEKTHLDRQQRKTDEKSAVPKQFGFLVERISRVTNPMHGASALTMMDDLFKT